jgi:hypothetical protein
MSIGGPSLGSARKAREALRARSEEVIKLYFETWKLALAAGDFETAQKCASDLAKHLPRDDDGLSVFDIDVDKPVQVEKGKSGPAIQIGVSIGGIPRAALPESAPTVQIIEIAPESNDPSQ